MVETMSKPLNSWAPEPAYPRYYPQELPGPGLRLPPLSSAVTTRNPSEAPLPPGPNAYVTKGNHVPYQGSYSTHQYHSDSHVPPHSPSSTAGNYSTANFTPRHSEDRSDRLSPTHSPWVGNPPDERATLPRNLPPVGGPGPYQEAPYQPPMRYPYDQQPVRPRSSSGMAQTRPLPLHTTMDTRTEQPLRSLHSPHLAWSPKSDTRPAERVKISDLLSNEQGPPPGSQPQARALSVQSPTTSSARPRYKLTIRQQPYAARSCGFGERDRRVIDPPPIVELKIDDPMATPEEIRNGLRVPFAVMHCTIWNEAGDQDISFMPEEYRQQRRLMGTTVSSPFNGRDENGNDGCFFCFPDLSVRTSGSFRLKFVLVMVDPTTNIIGARHPVRAQAVSEVFTVYSAKDFPGMQASTPLTKKLKEQGCLISIKKGNDKVGRGKEDSDEDFDDDDEGETGGSSSAKRRKQRK